MLNDRLLNDRYRVQEMIGGGGMANVYLAHDTILDREVAIKVLRLEHGNDEEFIARFHREAQSATSLSHPNIVNIYDVGEEDDIYFMVMEYVDGLTLKQYIQQHSPIDVSEAVDIMRQITSAIAHAHDNEIVHRDIKPQNILIDHYGHVKVTDFGIAMALSATALTQTNSVLGSVHYLSPEQARGGMATKKSDVYSLGIVFFELLTGRLPFSGESPVSIALKHLQHDTPSLKRWISDLPQSVENVVLKSTAKDPFHRYESVLDMEHDIETSLEPYRMDEPAFEIPTEDDEEKTKAIPVITNESYGEQQEEDTIIHSQTNGHKPVTNQQETKQFNEPDEPVEKDNKKKKKRKWPWLIFLFLFIIAAGVAIFTIPGIVQPANVEMIDVTGMEYEEAYSELSDLNLNVKRETVYSDEVDEGYVIRTDPEAGRTIKEESEVTVYSSRGKERVTFKDYTGQDIEQVNEELERKGFEDIDWNTQYSEEYEKGQIIRHITPLADTEVVPEEATVYFTVSDGPPKVELLRLEGMTQQEAIDYLEGESLNHEVVEEFSSDVDEGKVIKHDPGALAQVDKGSTVTLYISKGPEEKEEPEEPEETESPKAENPEENDSSNKDSSNNESSDDGSTEEESDSNQDNEQTEEAQAPVTREQEVQVKVPFNKESEEPEQQVLIYIGDYERNIEEVAREETITEDTTFDLTLTIEEGKEANYKVMRGDEVIADETVEY